MSFSCNQFKNIISECSGFDFYIVSKTLTIDFGKNYDLSTLEIVEPEFEKGEAECYFTCLSKDKKDKIYVPLTSIDRIVKRL